MKPTSDISPEIQIRWTDVNCGLKLMIRRWDYKLLFRKKNIRLEHAADRINGLLHFIASKVRPCAFDDQGHASSGQGGGNGINSWKVLVMHQCTG